MKNTGQVHQKDSLKRFIQAANLLPERLWKAVFTLSPAYRIAAEEFRLRVGQPMAVTVGGAIRHLEIIVYKEDIEAVLAKATRCSIHCFEEQLQQGFLTTDEGHRIGLCGRLTTCTNGLNFQEIFSINIRIARQFRGIGDRLQADLFHGKELSSVLILSLPGVGKTTLLRDLCLGLAKTRRVSVADCRFELGGKGLDLGQCDLMQGGNKAKCIEMLTRSMSPEIIAVDEITAQEDVAAICASSHTGVHFLASAHGSSIQDLYRRPLYRDLMHTEIFKKVVLLSRAGEGRTYRIFERSDQGDKNHWIDHDCHFLLNDGFIVSTGDDQTKSQPERPYHSIGDDTNRDLL